MLSNVDSIVLPRSLFNLFFKLRTNDGVLFSTLVEDVRTVGLSVVVLEKSPRSDIEIWMEGSDVSEGFKS
jgi:hypothetical protein